MKKTTLLSLIALSFLSVSYAQEVKQKTKRLEGIKPENFTPSGMIRCATDEYEEFLHSKDTKRMSKEQFEAYIAPYVEQYKNTPANASQSGGIIYIPVVVHVIHNGDAYGTNENITDEQVQSQITVMTQDYRRMAGTPGFNTNAVGADVQIEFVLAKVDPNGNPTNGIDRVNLCTENYNAGSISEIQDLIDTQVKPQTIWNPTQYMNMWSVNWDGSDLLGYAQFPSTSTSSSVANTDGVVAGYGFFGSSSLATGNFSPPFDKGRTMTHEVGHFLGLYHTFQGGCAGENATSGDLCADTPAVASPNGGCSPVNSCPTGGNDMIQNYMDYTDDACMNIFTIEQKARITSVMNIMQRRASLKTSTKDQPIPLFANDAELKFENVCTSTGAASCSAGAGPTAKVTIYNRGTSALTSAVIAYNINGGTSYNYSWSGNLAQNKYATFDMPITNATNGTLNAAITTANGVTDQRATNNSVSKAFTAQTGPTNYSFNNYVFRLQNDFYGAETTWTLKNQAGTTLYSGGPYTNSTPPFTTLPAVITQNWTLPSNDCYVFNITDSQNDGICCGYGQGYYDIKSTDGATIVASGGSFTSSESKAFSINLLSNETFETLNDVYVFPNPTKSILNIAVPSGVDMIKNVAVYNYLGQVVAQKTIASQDDLSIDTTNFSNGVYLITVTNGTQNKTLRFIKE